MKNVVIEKGSILQKDEVSLSEGRVEPRKSWLGMNQKCVCQSVFSLLKNVKKSGNESRCKIYYLVGV